MTQNMGFKRILLATDGSGQADSAVEAAIDLAVLSSARVRVAHVWTLEVHHRHGIWDVEMRSEAEQLVQKTVERFTAAGVLAEREILLADNGHVAAAIALSARQFEPDLVVVGSRGLSDLQSIFRHSVSHQIVAALDCPVLVVRQRRPEESGPVRRILVAIAGGGDVIPAVRAAVAAGLGRDSQVLVAHVAQDIFGAQGFAYVESDDEIAQTLGEAVNRLKEEGITADSIVLPSGPVARTVASLASSWAADLIVVGSNRLGDLTGLVLGSVSHALISAAEVPVLIAARAKS